MRRDYNPGTMRNRAALLSFALALAGCGELRWAKPGADEAALTRDLSACRQLAQQSAARAGNIGLPPVSDPRFGGAAGPTLVEQRMQEQQALDACMRSRGYALVPAD